MSNLGSSIELTEVNAGYRKQGGGYREWIYEGTADAVVAAFSGLFGTGETDDLLISRSGNNKFRLAVRRDDLSPSGSFPLLHQVRLINHRIHKSIFEPPMPGEFAALNDADIAAVKEAIKKPAVTVDGNGNVTVVPTSFPKAAQQHLYTLALRGVQHRIVYQPHLIRQTAGINTRVYTISFSNVGKLFTTANVVADAGISGPLRYNLPNDVSTFADYSYGWLKHGASVEPGPENIEVLSQEYEYGLWSTLLYEFAA